jgi:hypothetical protein
MEKARALKNLKKLSKEKSREGNYSRLEAIFNFVLVRFSKPVLGASLGAKGNDPCNQILAHIVRQTPPEVCGKRPLLLGVEGC